jgi:hypothetical protein
VRVDTDAASRLAKGLRESRVRATRVLAVRAEVQPDRDGEDAMFSTEVDQPQGDDEALF